MVKDNRFIAEKFSETERNKRTLLVIDNPADFELAGFYGIQFIQAK